MRKLNNKGVGLIDALLSIVIVGITMLIVSHSIRTTSNLKLNGSNYVSSVSEVEDLIIDLYSKDSWKLLDGTIEEYKEGVDCTVKYKYKELDNNIEQLDLDFKGLPIKERIKIERYKTNERGYGDIDE